MAAISTGLGLLILLGAIIAFRAIGLLWTQVSSKRRITSGQTLEDRLEELSRSMQLSARLVEQVSEELEVRAATAKKLKEDAETAEALASLHKEQAAAIRHLLDVELKDTARHIRRDSIVIGIASFVAGGSVTLLVTLLVHPLS